MVNISINGSVSFYTKKKSVKTKNEIDEPIKSCKGQKSAVFDHSEQNSNEIKIIQDIKIYSKTKQSETNNNKEEEELFFSSKFGLKNQNKRQVKYNNNNEKRRIIEREWTFKMR